MKQLIEIDLQDHHHELRNFNQFKNGKLEGKIQKEININMKELTDFFYPVGTIYHTYNKNFNPMTSWGGTWVLIAKDTYLIAATLNEVSGASVGTNNKTLTVDELPSHTHTQQSHGHSQNSHNHRTNVTQGRIYKSSQESNGYGLTQASAFQNRVAIYENGIGYDITGSEQPIILKTTAINNNTGGGQAFDNRPKSQYCYIWKRTG